MSKIISFPNWKNANATSAEKLYELAEYATRHPEDVSNLLMLWINEQGETVMQVESSIQVATAVFMLEKAKVGLVS
jgi:hypothetical protein